MPENVLWMHDTAARELGVWDGENVVVSDNGYSATIKARVGRCIHPEAVFMVTDWRSIPTNPGPAARGFGYLADERRI